MKNATLSITLSAVLIVCLLIRPGDSATAQDYNIRVDSPVNLRASYSTEADVVAIVPSNTVLRVIGRFNRWLKVNWQGIEVWLADWVNYTRVDNAPTLPPSIQAQATQVLINNYCFTTTWNCKTEVDWVRGWEAWQREPYDNVPQYEITPTDSEAWATQDPINNYCYTTWNCKTEVDWVRGWEAWQREPYGNMFQYEPTPTDWDSAPQPSPTPSLDWDRALREIPPYSTPYFDSTPIFPEGWDCRVVPPSEFNLQGYSYCSPTPTAKQLASIVHTHTGDGTIKSVDLEPGIYEITFLLDLENTREGKVEVMNKGCFASGNRVILHNLSPIPRPYNMVGSRWHTDNLHVDHSCQTDIEISNIVGWWELVIVPQV